MSVSILVVDDEPDVALCSASSFAVRYVMAPM